MTTFNIATPYPVFTDPRTGLLATGKLYIGEAGKNPETYPVKVYNDKTLATVLPQPISLVQGVPVRNGAPTQLYTEADNISFTTRNQYGIIIQTNLNFPNVAPPFQEAVPIAIGAGQNFYPPGSTFRVNFNNYIFGDEPFSVIGNYYLQQTFGAKFPMDIVFGFSLVPDYHVSSDSTVQAWLNLYSGPDFTFVRCYDSQTMYLADTDSNRRPNRFSMQLGVSSISLAASTFLGVEFNISGFDRLSIDTSTEYFTGLRYTRRS